MSLISQPQYESIVQLFQENGKLTEVGCVPRHGQQLMVDHICHALDTESSLLCEAPTGVGKTFSYLFPLAQVLQDKKASNSDLRVVISTATKNLQHQLADHDFPAMQKFFPSISTYVWMGASNYLCGVRLHRALQNTKLDRESRRQLEALVAQSHLLRTLPHGWREELPIEISDRAWEEICGDTRPCCHAEESKELKLFCHKRRAFFRATQSDILCVNHSLLCNLAVYTGQIHPNVDKPENLVLVIDEAHELEDNLRRCLNQNISITSLRRHLRRIENAEQANHLSQQLDLCSAQLLSALGEEPEVVTKPTDLLVTPLRKLADFSSNLSQIILDQSALSLQQGQSLDEADYREVMTLVRSLQSQGQQLQEFLQQPTIDRMLEISRPFGGTAKEPTPLLTFATFDLESKFSEIWKHSRLNILTSATLFNGEKDELCQRVGLPEADTTIIPPTFDYKSLIRAYAVDRKNVKQLADEELAEWIKKSVNLSAGNALVLFTSYKTMGAMQERLSTWCQSQGYHLLVQSRNISPRELIASMQKQANTILFGTSSLWTGIDIKGSKLSNVVITKLPFRMLDNFSKQYSRYLESKGANAFAQWSIPEMISRTRQGAGRLIRDAQDRGLLFVLDPRFIHSAYARQTRNHILPDENGQTVLEWNRVSDPSALEAISDSRHWLGVKDPLKKTTTKKQKESSALQDNLPF